MILTVIGGGSSQWMKSLMRDVYLLDEVDSGEIRLVDPKREHVEAVARMLETFNRMRNKDYQISVTDDRRAALKGADFVMTTFSPGSMDAFYNDLEIPIKYGIRIPVSMTVGPPGISAALSGDRDLAVQAMSLDPLSAGADFSEIAAMTDELLLANRAWLPRFA